MRPDGKRTEIHDLIRRFKRLQDEMLRMDTANLTEGVSPEHKAGARNLLHYLALRSHDIRELQQQLAALGLSSLGRTESHVMGTIRAVMRVLAQLGQFDVEASLATKQVHDLSKGRKQLDRNTDQLLGPQPEGRRVRIMVTMPSEAATDYDLVRRLVCAGMNCMRINCAHDGPAAWTRMLRNLRRARKETGKRCTVLMDLAGPKLRTGTIDPGPPVVKYRPKRDDLGRVVTPARIWLTRAERPESAPEGAHATLPLPAAWLARLRPESLVRFVDARGARRILRVRERVGGNWWAEAGRTAYILPGTEMTVEPRSKRSKPHTARVADLPPTPRTLTLHQDDTLILTRDAAPGHPARLNEAGEVIEPARIGVTLPEFFECVRPNDPIWFDDGTIGGVITAVAANEAVVRIVQARPAGEKLGAGKGINIPKTDLRVSPLTSDDLEVLPFVARHANVLGYSFVKTAADVRELLERLQKLGPRTPGLVLKIETRQAFENLPQLLMEAMRGGPIGVMIARGDLAVECGFERMAEIQEEILWIAEAAHAPVVWATQVLETLAKTGRPSRSEITDAAMGERAECVMLNKGRFIVEAVHVLDDILRRMEEHQQKKTPMLRKLKVAAAFRA